MRALARVGVLAVAAALLAGCAIPTPPPPLPDTWVSLTSAGPVETVEAFTQAQRSAYRVRMQSCTSFFNGSAWAVSEHQLITNSHVVEGGDLIEVTSFDGRDYTVTASWLATNGDLALLEVEESLPTWLGVAGTAPQPRDPVTTAGYPAGDRLFTGDGFFQGYVDELFGDYDDKVMRMSVYSEPGSSGSAVVNSTGLVVSVLYAGRSNGGEESYGVALETLQDFLTDESLREAQNVTC